jgi:RND family efflux transporter MFP subunit
LNRAALGSALLGLGLMVGFVGSRQFPAGDAADNKSAAEGDKTLATEAGQVTLDEARQASAGVVVAVIAPEPLVSRTWRTGRVALDEDTVAHVCPLAEGIVREVLAKHGQTVAAGETLAIIDSRELGQAKLEAYKARIGLSAEREIAARTRQTMANADELLKLLVAETPVDEIEKAMADKPIGDWRQQLLGAYTRRNQSKSLMVSQRATAGAVAEATLRKTIAEAEAAGAVYTSLLEELKFQSKNLVRQAELKLKEAETVVEIAQAKLLLYGMTPEGVSRLDPIAEGVAASHLFVKAPFAGTVVEKHAVRSERVGPQTQMFVIADLSQVWVQADVYEADLPLIRGLKGSGVVFRSPIAGIPERPAKVVYTGDLIEKSSRSLTLTAEADNPDRVLKPGLFVEVGFDTGDRTPTLQVPVTAVLRHENQSFVFVQTGEDTFRRRDVDLGRTAGDKVEVTAGVKSGEKVVVRGGFVLKSELLKDQLAGE